MFFEKWSPDQHLLRAGQRREVRQDAPLESFHELDEIRLGRDLACNTKGYSSAYLAMGFANVRAGTQKRRGVFWVPARTLANTIAR